MGDEPTADVGAIDQSNTVSATADATVSADVTQAAAQIRPAPAPTRPQSSSARGESVGAVPQARRPHGGRHEHQRRLDPGECVSNPALSQRNAVAVAASVAETTVVSQAGIQSVEGQGIEWHESATQTASVDQSGATASAAAVQSGHENTAGWNGLVRALQQAPVAEPAQAAGLTTMMTLFMVQPAEPLLGDPYLRPFITPPDVVAAARKAHPQRHVFGKRIVVAAKPLTIQRFASRVAAAATQSAAAPARGHAQEAAEARPPAHTFRPPRPSTASVGAGSAAPPAGGGATGAASFPSCLRSPVLGDRSRRYRHLGCRWTHLRSSAPGSAPAPSVAHAGPWDRRAFVSYTHNARKEGNSVSKNRMLLAALAALAASAVVVPAAMASDLPSW